MEELIQTLQEVKATSTLELLFRCSRRLNEFAIARLQLQETHPRPRAAHLALFAHIDFAGTRATTIAAKTGTTKQAVGQLLDDLERWGLIERIADPEDRRAKLVRFTEEGLRSIVAGLEHLRSVEALLKTEIGAERMAELREALRAIDGFLQAHDY